MSTFRRNVTWQIYGSVGQAILGGILLLIIGKTLAASRFGEFSIIMGYVYVVNLIFEPRIQDVAARMFAHFESKEDILIKSRHYLVDLFLLESAIKILPCCTLIVFSPLFVKYGNLSDGSATIITVAAIGTYFSKVGYGLSIGLLRVLGRSDLIALCINVDLLIRLFLSLMLVLFWHLSVFLCVVVLCISGVITIATQWNFLNKIFGMSVIALHGWKVEGITKRLCQNRRLLLSNIGLSIADLMNKDLDVTLISPIIYSDAVGVYKMAKNIVMLTWRAIDPFYLSLMPEINRLVLTNQFDKLKKLLIKSSFGLAVLAVVISFITWGLTVEFGEAVLGPTYKPVEGLMGLMFAGVVLSAPLVWAHPLTVALNRSEMALIGSLVSSIAGILTFMLLTPAYGVDGAAISWAMTFLASFMLTAILASNILSRHITKYTD